MKTHHTDRFYQPRTRISTGDNHRRTRVNHKPGWIALGVIVALATITALSS